MDRELRPEERERATQIAKARDREAWPELYEMAAERALGSVNDWYLSNKGNVAVREICDLLKKYDPYDVECLAWYGNMWRAVNLLLRGG